MADSDREVCQTRIDEKSDTAPLKFADGFGRADKVIDVSLVAGHPIDRVPIGRLARMIRRRAGRPPVVPRNPAESAYVVTRPYPQSNVGSNLSSMAGAVWLAGQLGRTLIVDWRGQAQLPDKNVNFFSEFFIANPEILGVPILYAPASVGDYAVESDVAHWVEPGEAHLLGTGQAEAEATFIVCQTYHGLDRLHPGPEDARFRFLREFYGEIQPAPEIAAAADAWWTENLGGAFVVGVNVRTGNGRYFGENMKYSDRVDISVFDDPHRLLRRIESACRASTKGLPKQLRQDHAVFYATDSESMSALLGKLPMARTRRTVYPPPDSGDLYSFEEDESAARASVVDSLVDMFLLARCDALVYNSSLFNQYARVSTGYFGGNLVHIETLFLRKRLEIALAIVGRKLAPLRTSLLRKRLKPAFATVRRSSATHKT